MTFDICKRSCQRHSFSYSFSHTFWSLHDECLFMLNPYGTYANSTDPNQTPHNAGYSITFAYILGNPGVIHSVPTALRNWSLLDYRGWFAYRMLFFFLKKIRGMKITTKQWTGPVDMSRAFHSAWIGSKQFKCRCSQNSKYMYMS